MCIRDSNRIVLQVITARGFTSAKTMKLFALSTRVGQRFLAILLSISLLPLVFVGGFALRTAETALSQQTLATLRAASDGVEAQLREFLKNFHDHMTILASTEDIHLSVVTKNSPGHVLDSARPDLGEVLDQERRRIPEVQEIFVATLDGRILASSDRQYSPANVRNANFFIRGLQGFFAGEILKDEEGQFAWIMSFPIRDSISHRALAVLAFRVDPSLLSDLTTGRRVLAEGADTPVSYTHLTLPTILRV